jgi:hypothetical protein
MHQLHLAARREPVEAPRSAAEITLRARETARLEARARLKGRPHGERERRHRLFRAVTRVRARWAGARPLGA